MINASLKEKLLQQAFRAPSVHNVQPWLLQVKDDRLIVFDDLARSLAIGDKALHDHEVSLGAFTEGIDLILSTASLKLAGVQPLSAKEVSFKNRQVRPRYELRIERMGGGDEDPLAKEISRRRSFRGVFAKADQASRERLKSAFTDERFAVVGDVSQINEWAKEYDACAVQINAKSEYQAELYHWLRLTKAHPAYNKDGLNREALGLSAIEGSIANVLMRPKVYQFLNRLGLASLVVSEAPQIRSSTGLLFLFKLPNETPFEAGRRFYRAWLNLSRLGFHACPLSSLVDDEISKQKIQAAFPGRIPLNVLRVGVAGDSGVYQSARLNTSDFLVEDV